MKQLNLIKIFLGVFLLCCVTVFAQTQRGGGQVLTNPGDESEGKTYAVIIGISNYQHIPQLQYADRDAQAFYDFLRSKSGGNVDSNNIKLLLDQDATGIAIRTAISSWLMEEKKPQKGDKVFIYFAGHGDALSDEESYLLGWDQVDGNPEVVYDGGYNIDIIHLKKRIKKLTDAGVNLFLITDACRGRDLPPGGEKGRSNMANSIMESKEGEIQFTSCSGGEVSVEDRAWGGGRGLYSYWLINGLYGMADKNKDGFVTVGELEEYVTDSVESATTRKDKNGKMISTQNPFYCCSEYNRETICKVDTAKKREIATMLNKQGGEGQLYAALDKGRGINDSKSKLPDTVKALYKRFQEQIRDEELLYYYMPCAYSSYKTMMSYELPEDFSLSLKNELTVALINEGQQVMNYYVSYKSSTPLHNTWREYFEYAARCLDTARRLVGKEDELYPVINRNRLIFEAAGYAHITDEFNSFDKGKMNNALTELDSARLISSKPSAIISHTYAYIYTALHNYPEAVKADSMAHVIAPDWSFPLNGLGNSYDYLRQYEKAEQCYLKALEIDSTGTNALNNLGLVLSDEKKYDKAEYYFLKALKFDSTYTSSLYGLGKLYKAQNQLGKAEQYFLKAIHFDSTYSNATYSLASIYSVQKKQKKAEQFYLRALQMDSLNTYAYIGLGNLYEDWNNYAKAKEYYRKALDLDSTYTVALYNLGITYKDQKLNDSAAFFYKKAIHYDSTYLLPYYGLGSLYQHGKRYDLASKYYLKIVSIDSTYSNAWLNLGVINETNKNYKTAEIYYLKAGQMDPKYSTGYQYLGDMDNKLNRSDEAKKYFGKAIQIDSNDTYSLYTLGQIYDIDGQYETAEKYYNKTLQSDSTYYSAFVSLATIYEKQKDLKKAENYFLMAVHVDTTSAYLQTRIGSFYQQHNNITKAIECYLKAIKVNPSYVYSYYNLGLYYQSEKDYDKSLQYFIQGIKADSTFSFSYLGAGSVYKAQKQYEKAYQYFLKGHEVDTTEPTSLIDLITLYDDYKETPQTIKYTGELERRVDTTTALGLNYMGYATLYQRQFARAENYYNKVLALDTTAYSASYNLACAYSLEKNTAKAIKFLDLSIRTGYIDYAHMQEDTDLDNIRNTPEFKAVMKKYFPEQYKE